MKSILPYSILISLAACVPSGEFVDFKGDVESLSEIQASITALQSEVEALKESNAQLEAQNTQLQTDLDAANQNIDDLENTASGGSDLTDQLIAATDRITALESAGEVAATEVAALGETVAINTANITTNSGDISTNSGSITSNAANVAANTASISAFSTEVTGYATTIATNTSSIASNTADIATNTANISSMDSDLSTAESDIDTLQSDYTSLSGNVLSLIDADTTWNVGSTGDYATLEDAMEAARSVQIHPDATLTLQLANDLYYPSDEINLNHPQGANIIIQGNTSDNTLVKLEFSGTNGLVLNSGHTIGGIHDLTIQGDGTALYGLNVVNGSTAYLYNVIIDGTSEGIHVWNDSAVYLSGSNLVQNVDGYGVSVRYNSLFDAEDYAIEISNSGSDGFHVGMNSAVKAHYVQSTGNRNGAYVFGSSSLWTIGASYSNNSNHGLVATDNSFGQANNGTHNNNGGTGGLAAASSSVVLSNSTVSDNHIGVDTVYASHGGCNGCTISNSTTHGARIYYTSSADLSYSTIENSGEMGVYSLAIGSVGLVYANILNNGTYGTTSAYISYIYDYGTTRSGNQTDNQTMSSTFGITN